MCATISGIIAIILSVTIAILALSIGGFAKVLKLLYYLHFQPARFYFNAMRAIERLEALSDTPLEPLTGPIKQGIINYSDVGFRELTEILRENRVLKGNIDEIVLGEENINSGMRVGNTPLTPTKRRFLGLIKGNEQEEVLSEQWDIYRITRNLKDWALEITRNRVANWIIGLITFYLIASIVALIIK